MAFYAVDMRDRIPAGDSGIERGGQPAFCLIEAVSAKRLWAETSCRSATMGSDECDHCHHRYCSVCEQSSVVNPYSGYWLCHCCGKANPCVSNFY